MQKPWEFDIEKKDNLVFPDLNWEFLFACHSMWIRKTAIRQSKQCNKNDLCKIAGALLWQAAYF